MNGRTLGEIRNYTYAHEASATGIPKVLVVTSPDSPQAREHDLEYLLGNEVLVVPLSRLMGGR